jgi:predicted lipoprotein with Yx(FWY)xxD motif
VLDSPHNPPREGFDPRGVFNEVITTFEGSQMPRSPQTPGRLGRPARRARLAALLVAAFVAGAAFAGLAAAKPKHVTPTLNTARSSKLNETIVVDSHGVTLYTLSGETARHLKCTPQAVPAGLCFKFWPPVTVHSARSKITAAKGIKGKLGIIHRNGFFQVTLGGSPLYYFMLDHAKKGSVTGEGIPSFMGVWHVVKVSGTGRSTTTGATHTTTSMTTSTMTTSTYTYP